MGNVEAFAALLDAIRDAEGGPIGV
jgi:hypothetical protein